MDTIFISFIISGIVFTIGFWFGRLAARVEMLEKTSREVKPNLTPSIVTERVVEPLKPMYKDFISPRKIHNRVPRSVVGKAPTPRESQKRKDDAAMDEQLEIIELNKAAKEFNL